MGLMRLHALTTKRQVLAVIDTARMHSDMHCVERSCRRMFATANAPAAGVPSDLKSAMRICMDQLRYIVTKKLQTVLVACRMRAACLHTRCCSCGLRTKDLEHYMCIALAPEPVRSALFILRAFNMEVATVKDHAREPKIALIRLQWWRDAVEKCFAGKFVPVHFPTIRWFTSCCASGRKSTRTSRNASVVPTGPINSNDSSMVHADY